MKNESTSRETPVTKGSNSISRSIAAALLFASLGLTGCTGVVSGPKSSVTPAPTPSPSGALSAIPASASFPNVVVGSSNSQTITLTNSESANITISQATVSGAGFSSTGLTLPATMAAGQSASFNVVFTPTSATASTGSIALASTATNSSLAISLSGTASTPTYQLSLSPANFSFGNVFLGIDEAQDLLLTNTGNSTVNVSSASASGQGFALSGLSGPMSLAPGQFTTLTINFTPTVAGNVASAVTVTSNATQSPSSLISGTGTTPSVTLSWDPSASAVSYNVYRGTLLDGPYTKINSVPTTQFKDLTVLAGQTYTYVVTSVDSSSVESPYSNTSTATVD
jgi:Abnormal spindle-like microcephaly-assoc'd, ASPM-SPD-2-Hydin